MLNKANPHRGKGNRSNLVILRCDCWLGMAVFFQPRMAVPDLMSRTICCVMRGHPGFGINKNRHPQL